ncbi:MAG: metallophosphoesterase [Labilithrix sp.]|nr:metallophosphoesterase [Labilithrix sp.]MCW5818180.1 metallophosphoesterase [Labilithrix sp.]
MRLLAVSDLHVRQPQNRRFVEEMAPSRGDWLILGGDLGESEADLKFVFEALAPRFARLVWVPGNHELWSLDPAEPRGEERYERLVALARRYDVLTPEDDYAPWPEDPRLVVAPLFLLYDYSFRPDDVADPIAWAAEEGIKCADEIYLRPDPYPSRAAWCAARCDRTEARLAALSPDTSTVLVNHFPLRQAHAHLPLVPRFSIWCGTRRTEDWHRRFRARAVVFGHLHIRQERVVDGVTFHEVSLGYRRQWNEEHPARYVRQVWPPVD